MMEAGGWTRGFIHPREIVDFVDPSLGPENAGSTSSQAGHLHPRVGASAVGTKPSGDLGKGPCLTRQGHGRELCGAILKQIAVGTYKKMSVYFLIRFKSSRDIMKKKCRLEI